MHADEEPTALSGHLGFWLRMVSNHVSAAFARRLEGKGVTVAEWVMLRELFDAAPLPPSRLADRMGMTRGAISKLADRLLDKGLAARTDDPDDGRAHSLSLTDAGRALVPGLARLADQNEAECFAALTMPERAMIEAALRRVVADRGLTQVPVT